MLYVDGQPNLTRWILDYDDNKITLSFDILSLSNNGMPIDCTAILVGPTAGDISMAVRVLPSVVGLQVNNTTATCDLGMKFRHVLDNTLSLKNALNLFLYYKLSGIAGTGMLLQDSNGMIYENVMGTPAVEIVPDSSPPAVMSFELLDLDNGELFLLFSQPINVTTLNFANLSLLSSLFTETLTVALALSDGNCSDGCEIGRHITLSLKSSDLDRLKLENDLCTSVSNCYFYYTGAFVKDFGDNAIANYNHSTDFLLQNITLDETSPSLLECILNLLLDQLHLVFNEPIDVNSFNPYGINISTAVGNVILTSASVIKSHNNSDIIIYLGLDVDRIKISLPSGSDNISVSLISSAFKDIAGTSVHPDSILCTFINDTNPPNISFFILDLNSNLLQIVFDEPIYMESVNMSGISLIRDEDAMHVATVNLGDSILIDFDDIDLFHGCDGLFESNNLRAIYIALKNNSLIAVKTGNIFFRLFIADDSLFDLSDNGYISSGPIVATDVIEDNSPATVVNFLLDMNTGQIILTFNDVVDLSTLYLGTILLQDSAYSFVNHRPYGSYNNSINSSIIQIHLPNLNQMQLKDRMRSGLATGVNSTYMTIDANALDDIHGVDIIGITNGNGMMASDYIKDSKPPMLTSFNLDLNNGYFSLTFDEPVLQAFNFTLFSLQADSMNITNTSINFSHSQAELRFFLSYSTIFIFYFRNNSFIDLLHLHPTIAVNDSTTNLVVVQGGVFDVSGNPIDTTEPVNVYNFRPKRKFIIIK